MGNSTRHIKIAFNHTSEMQFQQVKKKNLSTAHTVQLQTVWKPTVAYSLMQNLNFLAIFNKHQSRNSTFIFLFLEGIVCIPPHSNPTNGAVTCSDRSNEGSRCDFTCNANYALNGSPQSVCRDDGNGDGFGAWSSPAPTCDRKSKYR